MTAKKIERSEPGPARREIIDSAYPGLQLWITPNGVKSFWWATTRGDGSEEWITLGRWSMTPKAGHLTLGEAHRWVERLRDARVGGPAVVATVAVPAAFQDELLRRTPRVGSAIPYQWRWRPLIHRR